MVMLRDELMAEVGGGMEEDRESGSGGNPSTGRRRHGPKCEDVFAYLLPAIPAAFVLAHIFCFSLFVIVCVLFVYCLFIIALGHAKSSIFRVQSAVRGHGTARAHYTPPTTHGGTGTRPHTGTRGIGGVTKHKLLILAKTPNGTLPIRTIETKRLSLKREPN